MSTEPEHLPIPVNTAQNIAETYNKTHVVIVGYDERINMFHRTTFGLRDDRDKQNAAAMGEHIMKALGATPLVVDDFGAPSQLSLLTLKIRKAAAAMNEAERAGAERIAELLEQGKL